MSDDELLGAAPTRSQRARTRRTRASMVGAAILTRDGRTFEGVNVENAAYPLGVCAERTVLSRAATEGVVPGEVEAIAITASPCGGCRQWLHEWKVERVTYRSANGEVVTRTPAELLPDSLDDL